MHNILAIKLYYNLVNFILKIKPFLILKVQYYKIVKINKYKISKYRIVKYKIGKYKYLLILEKVISITI